MEKYGKTAGLRKYRTGGYGQILARFKWSLRTRPEYSAAHQNSRDLAGEAWWRPPMPIYNISNLW